jgi:predicted ATPase
VVLIAGEPGIGKTRLVAELAALAREGNCLVLAGSAYDSGGAPPYLPFAEALSGYVRASRSEDLRAALGESASSVAMLLPEIRAMLPGRRGAPAKRDAVPDLERYHLLESVCSVLLNIGSITAARRGGGLLLLLDDLHWADASSLVLLCHLARRLAPQPDGSHRPAFVLVAGTYRTPDRGRSHPLTDLQGELARYGHPEPLVLSALHSEEVSDLVALLAGAPAAAPVVEAIYARTEGNPFFVGQMVRHLLAEHRDLRDPHLARRGWGVPAGVRPVIGTRLARLSAEALHE